MHTEYQNHPSYYEKPDELYFECPHCHTDFDYSDDRLVKVEKKTRLHIEGMIDEPSKMVCPECELEGLILREV